MPQNNKDDKWETLPKYPGDWKEGLAGAFALLFSAGWIAGIGYILVNYWMR